MNKEIEQKIANIRSCTDYRQMAWDWFPPAHADEYYFVSYSHKDYKEVFADIYALQEQGLHIWYDRELHPGKDWEIEARAHIFDFKCKGVIFYLSKNSVASDSIHKEIEFVKKSGKNYLSINLPVDGEELSGLQISERVQPELDVNSEKYRTLKETFNENVIYLNLSEDPRARAQRIKSALVSMPLLKFEISGGAYAIVTGINDINATKVMEKDFICRDEKGKIIAVKVIGNCAFANCRFLENVQLPDEVGIVEDYAFYNCDSLKRISISSNVSIIGEEVFADCDSLESIEVNVDNPNYSSKDGILYNKTKTKYIHIPTAIKGHVTIPNGVTSIGDMAFIGCNSLESITINSGTIGNAAFSGCISLKNALIGSGVIKLDNSVFSGCTALKNVTINGGTIGEWIFSGCTALKNVTIGNGVTQLGNSAFNDCALLTSVTISVKVITIGMFVFFDCASLKIINYNGTIAEWGAIVKGSGWDYGTPDYIIYCTDGEIHKDGKVIKY